MKLTLTFSLFAAVGSSFCFTLLLGFGSYCSLFPVSGPLRGLPPIIICDTSFGRDVLPSTGPSQGPTTPHCKAFGRATSRESRIPGSGRQNIPLLVYPFIATVIYDIFCWFVVTLTPSLRGIADLHYDEFVVEEEARKYAWIWEPNQPEQVDQVNETETEVLPGLHCECKTSEVEQLEIDLGGDCGFESDDTEQRKLPGLHLACKTSKLEQLEEGLGGDLEEDDLENITVVPVVCCCFWR